MQVAVVDPGPPHALHCHQAGAGARPLDAGGRTAGAAMAIAPAAGTKVSLFLAPLSREGADILGGDTGFALLPFGCFGYAVLFAQNVVLPYLKAGAALGNEFLVVQAFGHPHVGNGHRHRRVGTRLGGEPFAAVQGRCVVVVGIDVNHLDTQLF